MRSFIVVVLMITPVFSQTRASAPEGAQLLVKKYFAFETRGSRMASSGWERVNEFFVKPCVPPAFPKVMVIKPDYGVWEPFVDVDGATVVMVEYHEIGEIDSSLRFSPLQNQNVLKTGLRFKVISTNTHWELSSDRVSLRQAKGLPESRIEGCDVRLWLVPDAAIHYLKSQRATAKDKTLRTNADDAIRRLNER